MPSALTLQPGLTQHLMINIALLHTAVCCRLEMVISESGGQLQAAHLAADEQNPDGIYFVSHR
jgi:hypothetical protein